MTSPPITSTSSAEKFKLSFPENYDVISQIERFHKDSQKIEKEIISLKKRLDNKGFIMKAPKDVVEKEKDNLSDLYNRQKDISHIINQLKIVS